MQELKTTYKTKQTQDVEVTFTKTDELTSSMKPFIILDNEKYAISLFPVNVKPAKDKKSFIKYNVLVLFKNAGISFHMAIRELVDGGTLIAGQAARFNGQRAVITEWDPLRNISYERLAIPDSEYREIIAMVAEGTAVK